MAFHEMAGPPTEGVDDVCVAFCQDNSFRDGVVVPEGLEAVGLALASHYPTSYYPPEAFRRQLSNQATDFRYAPASFGGMGVFARKRILKGSYYCYEGPLQLETEVNAYTLAIPAGPGLGVRPDQVVYIDGRVSPTSLLGGMNEYIWDSGRNQFEFGPSGLVVATRDVAKDEPCYIGYGSGYDWDDYKIGLLHELAGLLLEAVGLFGHVSYEAPVLKLVTSMLGWEKSSLPLRRVGTGLERLLLGVVDNRIPVELVHSVYPSFLEVGDTPEPVGRWVERLCCSAAIVSRLGFRSAHNPGKVELSLDRLYNVLQAGQRSSKRAKVHINYGEEDEEDFPSLGAPPFLGDVCKFRVVSLNASNDPLSNREPMVESESMTMDELDDCLHGAGEELVCLGNPGLSVSEWTMTMTLNKDDVGMAKMRAVCQLAPDHNERCD